MRERIHHSRTFLNGEEEGGMAAVETFINAPAPDNDGYFDAEIAVSDCNRTTTLDFSVYSKEQADTALLKIARLRRAVVAFEKVLVEQLRGVTK